MLDKSGESGYIINMLLYGRFPDADILSSFCEAQRLKDKGFVLIPRSNFIFVHC